MRALHYALAALFVFGAVVQLNDPDPLRWVAIYLAAAVATVVAARRPGSIAIPAVVALVGAVWALSLAGGATTPISGLFQEWEMQNQEVEVSREFYGLAVITSWMLFLVARGLFLKRKGAAGDPGSLTSPMTTQNRR